MRVYKRKSFAHFQRRERIRDEALAEAIRAAERGLIDADLEKTTLRMLGRDALAKVACMAPKEIVAMRERAGVSRAVLAGYLNVAVETVSQWERGERRPRGAALKLLHVVKTEGLDAVR